MTLSSRSRPGVAHRGRNAVGAEDYARARRHFVQFLDENRSGAAQLVHHVPVVDDLLAHVNGSAIEVQRDLNHIDRAHDSGAKPSWPQ